MLEALDSLDTGDRRGRAVLSNGMEDIKDASSSAGPLDCP